MATTFNDALQLFNVGASSTTNINEGNVVIPEGSETLSDLLKLNYDFKETPFNPESKSYNIYIWNNNIDGEIRFYTNDAKNNNDFNKDFLSGNYSEPRLNFNTKIGKNGKLYYWHNFTLTNPAKLSGWYEISDNISSIESQLIFLDGLTGGLSASLILTNNNVGLLAGRVSIVEDAILLITTDLNMIGDDVISLRRSTQSIWDYMDFNNNPTIQNKLAGYIEAIQPYNLTQGLFDEANQLLRIQSSSALSAYRINLANNFTSTIGAVAFAGAVLGGIKYIADTQQRDNYSTELIRISDTLAKRPISSANNTLIHTGITNISGASGFPITNNEFIITIQKNAVLIIGVDIGGIANILLVDQIGEQPFAVNESITIDRTLLNGSAGNLVLNVASLGTLKQWTELKATYLQNKISKIDTKSRRKAGVIGNNDVNTNHFTNVDTTYTDYNGSSSEVITYKTLEINPDYKIPTAIQADSATNANTAGVAVKLQTKRKIANVDFDGSANIDISYTDLINKPTSFSDNIGIGTASSASYNLDIYNQSTARIRIQSSSDFGATSSIEFRKGVVADVWSDYRLINDNSTFKLQYENNDFPYGDATNIITWNRINVVNYIPIKFNDNVGIKTDPHATYALDVLGTSRFTGNIGINTTPHATYKIDCVGDIQATAFRGDGANITNLTLTTAKIYERFNQTNFAIVDDKIDLPAQYSINITGYDSPTLYVPNDPRRLKGKMNVSYDDRQGLYKLEATNITKTDNVAVLRYKAGDKISIRNTAENAKDFFLYDGFKYYMSVILVKRPSNRPLDHYVDDIYSTLMFEWKSSDGLEGRVPAFVMDYRPTTDVSYPFTTIMTFIVEAGYNYYLYKLWAQTEVSAGGTIFVELSGYGDDNDDFNRFYGAGQTFKLRSDYVFTVNDYTPRNYTPAQAGIALQNTPGLTKPRRGMVIDDEGGLSSVPISSDLITNMNTSHFTNNTGTNKIDISSTYVAPSATKLATARNIAGVGFDGSGAIDIPYFNLIHKIGVGSGLSITTGSATTSPNITLSLTATEIPDLGTGKITSGTFDIARIPDLGTGKITSGTFDIARIPDLGTGKITSGTFDILRIPDLGTGKITSGTFDILRIPDLGISKITNLQTTLDGKQATLTAGTGISIVGTTISSTSSFTPTSANLIGVFNATQFVNNTGTSKIDIDVNWKPTTCSIADSAMQLVSSRNIAGVAFNGTASIAIPFANIDGLTTELATKQATINSTAGQLIIGNGNGATTTNAGLTWTGGNTLNTTNLAVSTYATITRELTSVLSGGVDMFELRNNATNNLRFNQTWIGANDMRWQLIQKSNNVDYPLINFRNGKISVGTFSNPAYQLELVGDINITGAYRVNGNILKPANAVLADTATILATSRNIAGVAFNGSADIAIDYFGLNNRPIILQPTTTNLQLVTGYTLSVPGNLAVGTTAIPTNVLQVGAGGRLRISNGATDYTLLGTIDTDGSTNTSIVLSGNTRSTNAGNIQYLATASGGSHIFYTASATTRMTISSSGVNVNNDLGVSGNVGLGVAPSATYKLNVNGSLNATSVLVNGTPVGGGLSQGMTVQTRHLTYTQMDVKNNTGWDAINDNITTGFVIAITPSSASSKILVNMIAHIGTDPANDARWWGLKLYRRIGAGAWTEITGANGTETGAAAATQGTPVWISHNLGSEGSVYGYFVANVTGTYLDAPNTTSTVYYTAYWNQRLGDNPSASGYMWLNRAYRQFDDAWRPAPSSSWTATEIWDLGTPYVPPVGDTTITITSGNVGVGVAPNASYKLNVGGTISAIVANPIGAVDLLNLRYDANWGLRLQQNYTGAGNIQYDFIHRYNATDYNLLTFKGANVGLGTTNPVYKCHIKCSYNNEATGLHLDAGETDTTTNKYTLNIWPYVIAGGEVGWRFRTQNFTGGTHTPLTLNNYGNVVIAGNLNCANINCNNSYVLGTEVYARNSYDTRIRSDSGGMYLEMSGIGGSGEFLKLGAFAGMTAIDSGAGRMLRMRIGTGLSWEFNTNSTTWNAKGSTTWDAPSDHRIKEDIKKANLKICYDNVKNINLYRFKYIDGFKEATKQDRTQLGYIAQQVKQHFPKSVQRSKTRIEDKREIPDLASVDISQVNFTLFGAVKQLMRVVEKQSKRIKKLEEMLNIIDDDAVEDDADEPYVRMNCEDEVDIDDIEPTEPTEV